MNSNIFMRYQSLFYPILHEIIQKIIIVLTHNFIEATTKPLAYFFKPQNWYFMEDTLNALCMASLGEAMICLCLLPRVLFCTPWSFSGLFQSVSRKTAFGFNSSTSTATRNPYHCANLECCCMKQIHMPNEVYYFESIILHQADSSLVEFKPKKG